MKIDFHTHAFNDKIADKAISKLLSVDSSLKNYTNGTISDLAQKINTWGIDRTVVLPIATKPSQQNIINDWAKEIQNTYPQVISFGSVHPKADDVMEELERIKSLGLHGIKLHPDYQGFFIDEEYLYPIYQKCADLKLPVIFHGGFDPLSPDLIHATPEKALKAHKAVPQMTMIMAHLGGMRLWDDVEKYLVGQDIYFDTAYISGSISPEQYKRIIKNHGADKILLGSDAPWEESSKEIAFLEKLDIPQDDKELIYSGNAIRLLNLNC